MASNDTFDAFNGTDYEQFNDTDYEDLTSTRALIKGNRHPHSDTAQVDLGPILLVFMGAIVMVTIMFVGLRLYLYYKDDMTPKLEMRHYGNDNVRYIEKKTLKKKKSYENDGASFGSPVEKRTRPRTMSIEYEQIQI